MDVDDCCGVEKEGCIDCGAIWTVGILWLTFDTFGAILTVGIFGIFGIFTHMHYLHYLYHYLHS